MKDMQITLNQADIEQAISEFVTRKVKFENGIRPVIDLKATRGPEGVTATIDLSGSAPTEEVGKTTSSVERTPRAARASLVPQKATPVLPVAAEAAQEANEEAADESTGNEAADTAPETAEAASDAEGDQAEAEDDTPPTEKPKSIFANLSKPRNT
jgi:hypothetical protein